MKRNEICAVLAGVVLGLLGEGCSTPTRVTTISHPGLAGVRVEKVGVMPFLKGRHPTNVRENLNCSLCRLTFDPESVGTGAENTLTRYVHEAIYDRFEDRVIPMERVMRTYEGIPKDDERDTLLTLARKVGQALGANVMVLGTVWRYRDKTGSAASSMNPASVVFDIYLVDVRTGEMLWMGNYDETQRALSDNIWDASVFFSRGVKWLSANELAQYGVNEVLKQLPL
jgi:hypothetical protein